ncbi:MAG: hypothetical protein ACLUD0_05710 [Eubacterium ramulus]
MKNYPRSYQKRLEKERWLDQRRYKMIGTGFVLTVTYFVPC